jgi:hypothetical protein
MFGVKKVAHHAGLMEQMADTVGADLREAWQTTGSVQRIIGQP